MKGGTDAQFTLDADVAAEQLTQLLADRQTQPRAPVPTRRRGIALHERLEQTIQLRRRDPDARVPDRHV